MPAYIRGIGNISPYPMTREAFFNDPPEPVIGNRLAAVEPKYRDFIDPKLLRRMARVLKMGVASAKICLKDAGVELPDAIITGTGLGCLQDTEKFLKQLIESNEEMLSPTAFIQSTHNTVSAQIALLLSCTNYNTTYVHQGLSFEHAALDALMLLKENEVENALIGGVDEIIDASFNITYRMGLWRSKPVSNFNLFTEKGRGAIAGESAVFCLLTGEKQKDNYAELVDLHTFNIPFGKGNVLRQLNTFLQKNNLGAESIDALMIGDNGDSRQTEAYRTFKNAFADNIPVTAFKHLCGEHPTASAYATGLAAMVLGRQLIPDQILISGDRPQRLDTILIYNNFGRSDGSFMLLRKC